jgi:ATP/maltotriose-dependent transcriptional regulator MalT
MDAANELLAEAGTDDQPAWLYHFQPENLPAERGSALVDMGEGIQAAELLAATLDDLPPTFVRQRGIYLVNQASALRVAGDLRQACTVAIEAVELGKQTGSTWIMAKARQLAGSLDERAGQRPEGRALKELLHETARD